MHVLADLILIAHFTIVVFVVGGLALIWIGAAAGWYWIRCYWFRIAHLTAICLVAAEALIGMVCPLTEWEDALRGTHTEASFIARWIHRIMFFSFPESVFIVTYVGFAVVVALTLWLVPPRRP